VRTAREVSLPLRLDRDAGLALPAQVVSGFRHLLASGVLRPGDDLPSTRALAASLAVSRGTVLTAYEQLLAEGWFVAAAGSSTRVNPRLADVHPPSEASVPARSHADRGTVVADLRPGRPWQGDVVGPAWRSAWRRAADEPLDADVPALGWPPLRGAIADHLRRMRALVRDPGCVAVTAGGREGLALLLRAVGARTVGVEEPGYPSLRRVPPLVGAATVPLATDERGLVTAALPAVATPDVALLTPSHQFPLGGSLPADRRLELLAWARAHGVLVVEDDYDSELRYTTEPLPALTALDGTDGDVVLLGTFSTTISPALAAGYLVLPARLVPAVAQAREALGQPMSLVAQRALAAYLDGGALDRHTQRTRTLYRRRRQAVLRELRELPGALVRPMDGGLHVVVEHGRPEREVVADLAARGVLVSPLTSYWSGAAARTGLVFGFGGVTDDALARGLAAIRVSLGGTPGG